MQMEKVIDTSVNPSHFLLGSGCMPSYDPCQDVGGLFDSNCLDIKWMRACTACVQSLRHVMSVSMAGLRANHM